MKLIPKPHMLKSIRSRNWHLAGAIEELVDNSLGHGEATNVKVVIDNAHGIAVVDDGIGIDDINRIFRFGDASAHDKLSEIGQYGVGAKNATIYLGDIVLVRTIRDGRYHKMTVDWKAVERSEEWPNAYAGKGRAAGPDERGTHVLVAGLASYYHLNTTEKLARDLGQVFAPAMRAGVQITVAHRLKRTGQEQVINVEPFDPPDMTDEITITGTVESKKHGTLRWTGRAGLSASLTERYNGVHIAFGHRVIETTREPFYGESAPTLYCEVQLDDTTPWKHSLSEHKDKVVHNRADLVKDIYGQIRELLEKSSEEAAYVALQGMTAPIETRMTRALRGAGLLHVDPDEDPTEGGEFGATDEPIDERSEQARTAVDDGDPAKEAAKPTGVQIVWRTREQLEDKLWSWEISGKQVLIMLDKDQFIGTVGYPPKVRDLLVIQLVATLLSHAVEMEYQVGSPVLSRILTPKLHKQLGEWEPGRIAPYLNRAILEAS